jgi:hypothetical protein
LTLHNFPESLLDIENINNTPRKVETRVKPEELLKQIEPSDLDILKNDKVFLMILLYVYSTKDQLYYFLSRLNKSVGIRIL